MTAETQAPDLTQILAGNLTDILTLLGNATLTVRGAELDRANARVQQLAQFSQHLQQGRIRVVQLPPQPEIRTEPPEEGGDPAAPPAGPAPTETGAREGVSA